MVRHWAEASVWRVNGSNDQERPWEIEIRRRKRRRRRKVSMLFTRRRNNSAQVIFYSPTYDRFSSIHCQPTSRTDGTKEKVGRRWVKGRKAEGLEMFQTILNFYCLFAFRVRVTFLIWITPPKKTNSQIWGTDASSMNHPCPVLYSSLPQEIFGCCYERAIKRASSALSGTSRRYTKTVKLSEKTARLLKPTWLRLTHY